MTKEEYDILIENNRLLKENNQLLKELASACKNGKVTGKEFGAYVLASVVGNVFNGK